MIKTDKKNHKSAWFYVAIIFGMLLIFSFLFSALGLITGEKIIKDIFGSSNVDNNQNTNYQSPDTNSNPATKGTYQYTYSGNNDNTYLDRPNDKVNIVLSGSNDIITISKNTEVIHITISGSNNNILFCKEGYPTPQITKSGTNNQIKSIDC